MTTEMGTIERRSKFDLLKKTVCSPVTLLDSFSSIAAPLCGLVLISRHTVTKQVHLHPFN